MGVYLVKNPSYYIICDYCKKITGVDCSDKIYNGAQAVRSIGWSYGKNCKVLCDRCRRLNRYDKYKYNV